LAFDYRKFVVAIDTVDYVVEYAFVVGAVDCECDKFQAQNCGVNGEDCFDELVVTIN
jgi:hypothetical protein